MTKACSHETELLITGLTENVWTFQVNLQACGMQKYDS